MQRSRRGVATATVGQGSGGRFLTGRPPQYLPLSLDEVFEDAIGSYSMSQAAAAASRTPVATTGPILSVNNIEVIYDHVILVLKGVSLEVPRGRSEEHTSELQSLMRISYAVFCLTKQTRNTN